MTVFTGGNSDDFFSGSADNDYAYGGDGNDHLAGGESSDILAGEDGADTVHGGQGNDTLYAGSVSAGFAYPNYSDIWLPPTLDTGSEADYLHGGGGDDEIFAGYNDTVIGGNNWTFGDALLISFMGAPVGVNIDFREDVINNGSGTISDIERINWVQGSAFDDTIVMADGDSPFPPVLGMDGNDTLIAGQTTALLDGGEGDDLLDGRGSLYLQKLLGGAGDDMIYDESNGSPIYGGEGNDTIYGHSFINAGIGDDTIYVKAGENSDEVRGGEGADRIYADATQGHRNLYGDEGADVIEGSSQDDTMLGGAGTDILRGNGGNDALYSGGSPETDPGRHAYTDVDDSHDRLFGGDGSDYLSFGVNDYADGGDGFDIIHLSLAGAGRAISINSDDILSGGLSEFGITIVDVERVQAITGSAFADTITVATTATGFPVQVDGGAGDDTVYSQATEVNFFGGDGNDTFVSGIAWDQFLGGEGSDTVSYNTYEQAVFIDLMDSGGSTDNLLSVENVVGTQYDDTLYGNHDDNTLSGGEGNDILRGGAGRDFLYGGLGNDRLISNDGENWLYGDAGNDAFYIVTAADTDIVYAFGGTGSDRLDFEYYGRGRLIANMGAGDDAIFFNETWAGSASISLGEGDDTVTVWNVASDHEVTDFRAGDGGDSIQFNEWTNVANPFEEGLYALVQEGTHTLLILNDGSGRPQILLTLLNTDATTFTAENFGGFQPVVLDDISGPDDSETLIGTPNRDTINGAGGNDIIFGGEDTDTLSGGFGDDFIDGESGHDRIFGQAGWDTLFGGEGNDIIEGGNGNDSIDGGAQDDLAYGGNGNDVLAGGADDDQLYGQDGNDLLMPGSGVDYIDGGAGADTADYRNAPYALTIYLDSGFAQVANSVDQWSYDTLLNIENVDGTEFDDLLAGNGEDNILRGFGGNDRIYGNGSSMGGSDTLIGGDGDDVLSTVLGAATLNGGAGDDYLSGHSSVDSYLGGMGFDRISFFNRDATQGAVADLRTGIISNDGFGNSETMTGIEGLGAGTQFADEFYGDDSDNVIIGGYGGDLLFGFGGNDHFVLTAAPALVDGGAGIDLAEFGDFAIGPDTNNDGFSDDLFAFERIIVDLSTGEIIADGFGGSGTIANIENVTGNYFDDELSGDVFDNILEGRGGADLLIGRAGNDVLLGGDGPDRIFGGSGDDLLDGGLGEDIVVYTDAAASVTVSLALQGQEQDTLGAGLDTLWNFEKIIGSDFGDTLTGNEHDNRLAGGTGNDVLMGRDGADTLVGNSGWDTLDGGAGNDLLHGGNGNDRAIYITAAAGITVSLALAGAQETFGAGIDTLVSIEDLTGSTFADTLTGSDGDNQIFGDAGSDDLFGGFGNDLLLGQGGDDVIEGQAGWDTLRGDDGNDTLIGGNGGDMLLGGNGIDTLSGNSGFDRIYGGSGGDILSGGADRDLLFGEAGDDTISGDGGNDLLLGNNGDDTLDGGDGTDVVNGGAGNDMMTGGDGDDILLGNWGVDTMTGGAGGDSFLFKAGHTGSFENLADTILDFSRAEGDRIDLSQIDAIAGGGDDAFAFIGDAAFSGTAGELRVTATDAGLMVEGDTDGDGVADLFIAVDGLTDLTIGDFVL